jgi:ribosomal protein L11 methylase PrmA
VIANILMDALIELNDTLVEFCRSYLILSGILESQVAVVREAFSSHFHRFEITAENGWACITAERKDRR